MHKTFGVEGASGDADIEVDSDAVYPSGITQDALFRRLIGLILDTACEFIRCTHYGDYASVTYNKTSGNNGPNVCIPRT